MKFFLLFKNYFLIPVIAILLSLSLSSCSNKSEDASEEENVRKVFKDFIKSIESEDIDRYFSFITDDFIGYDAGRDPITDLDALRTELEELFSSHTFTLTNYISQEVIVKDDVAIHRHKGIIVLQSKGDGSKIEMDVKYLDIMKKDNEGNWKIYIHSVSPNK